MLFKCYFLLVFSFCLATSLSAQCPNVEFILIDACGTESDNEYVIFNSGGGFDVSDITVDFDLGNNAMLAVNNDINTNNGNQPGGPCGLQAGNLGIYTGGCNLVAAGPGDMIPAGVLVILQTASNPTFTIDLSPLCPMGQTIYVVGSSCARSIGGFTNAGSGLRTTNFSWGAACNESVVYDRTQLMNTPGAYFGPNLGYGVAAACNPLTIPNMSNCPAPDNQTFFICRPGPVISPPQPLAPAVSLFVGASSVTFHTSMANAIANFSPASGYGGQTAMPVIFFARVVYPDGCVVIGTLTLDFLSVDGNAGTSATVNRCSNDPVDLPAALGGGLSAGSFTDLDGSGVNLANPAAVSL
ncbi:MAG: hypothetical protein HC821_05270 [Lewinella sp.]|nr:hypothetical protein [Lewinella sp.]